MSAASENPDHAGGVRHNVARDGIAVAPALDLVLDAAAVPANVSIVDRRVVQIAGIAILLGATAALVGQVLVRLISFFTNFAFFGRFSFAQVSPADNTLGLWVLVVPIVGALIVGFMARYGSKAIRGHGIPEAMEQVLVGRSRIPARITFLKPLSAAISIGTGGPFGAEGPIIATGGALGSLVGQMLRTTTTERKTLLAAGAAAGMSAVFGSPVAAVLLAMELLLFEFRPRSIIPVALASATAAAVRLGFEGADATFSMPNLDHPSGTALAAYIVLGALVGLASVAVTRIVYWIEDLFELLPIHWMWWPAFGALAVGIVGYFEPRTLGVGYNNISDLISDKLAWQTVISLCLLKFISWSISLGSGTSGGTMAPLFTIGGGLGAIIGQTGAWMFPEMGIDVRIAALVGMAAIFAGASRAMLTSVVFAFEITLQPLGLLPLLGGCSAAYLISCLTMRNSLMTERIARRGIQVPMEYTADVLDQVLVRDIASKAVVTLKADDKLGTVRQWLAADGPETTHQGFPVLNQKGVLVGILTRRNLTNHEVPNDKTIGEMISRPLKYIYDDCTVRQAADHMVNHEIGRLPIVARDTRKLMGIITRSDILNVYGRRIDESRLEAPSFRFRPKSS